MSDACNGFRLAHTMMRVRDLEASLEFYCGVLGMQILRRTDYSDGYKAELNGTIF